MNYKFVYQTMLTCIGNKRKLAPNIYNIVEEIRLSLNKDKINIVDGFAGSNVISRVLSNLSDNLYVNDLELYSYLMAKCFLERPSEEQISRIVYHIDTMNNIADNGPYIEGIICKLYAPKDSEDIKEGERCFYTRENALIIDTLRKYIKDNIEFSEDNSDIYVYCLVPLLIKASINNNTSGVFKGFHKNGKKGCFGGKAKNALSRILKNIRLDLPVWSDDNFRVKCYNKDINAMIIEDLPEDIDIIYLDPPYNQHPYGSNYFMLNIIALNEEPDEISKVSGIPKKWNKSNYNYKNEAVISMKKLLEDGLKKSKMLLISYNNEGIITEADWKELFKNYNVNKYEIKYDTYKGSRNLKNREDKVIEILYLVSLNQSQFSAH